MSTGFRRGDTTDPIEAPNVRTEDTTYSSSPGSDHRPTVPHQHSSGPRERASESGGATYDEAELKDLADQFGITFVDLSTVSLDEELLDQFPAAEISRRKVLPFRYHDNAVVVATSDPFDLETLDELSAMTGLRLIPALARRDEISRLTKRHLGIAGGTIGEMVAEQDEDGDPLDTAASDVNDLDKLAEQRSVVKLVNELLSDAVEQAASDIHLEPDEDQLEIRYRVDGLLRVEPVTPEINQFRAAIITRIKIMAKLNIAEKRLPQDGRIKLRIAGRDIDIRVSVIPMLHGEGVVMRLLDKGRRVFDLQSLDLPPEIDTPFRQLIKRPHGIVLLTGPTGSGKTTTLYSVLAEIRDPAVKIITIEDPVEYSLSGIRQIQVHDKIGRTFAAGLRSILRHDPDVILVGEIRDGETAQSAIQAALTGHLVFSTLHTSDSCGAFTRLIDMGVEPYLVASTVAGVVAQRLVREMCSHCKTPFQPGEQDVPPDFPRPLPTQLWQPSGCRECHGSGYRGRLAIFELLGVDDELRQLCTERASSAAVRRYALSQGLMTLRQCGWRAVIQGSTSVAEVLRVTGSDF